MYKRIPRLKKVRTMAEVMVAKWGEVLEPRSDVQKDS